MNARISGMLIGTVASALIVVYSLADKGGARDESGDRKGHDSFSVARGPVERAALVSAEQAKVERGKAYLLRQVHDRVDQLVPFKNRMDGMSTLPPEDRQHWVAELSGEIAALETLKAAIGQAQTRQDIRRVADQVKKEWIRSRESVESAKRQASAVRETALIAEADSVASGIQKRKELRQAAGQNTRAQQDLAEAHAAALASARNDIAQAEAKMTLAGAEGTEAQRQLRRDSELLLKRSRDHVRGSYKLLAEAAREEFAARSAKP